MANEVYANGMEIACKAGAGKTICAMPDVVFTPPENPATPPGVPVPYPNTGMASDTTEGSKTVKISGEEVMLKNKSCFKKSTGDEAGAAAKKGVISSKNTGKVYFIKWSMDVKFEGENVDRHLDMTTNNHGSPANEAIPWAFLDAMAISKLPDKCKEIAKNFNDNCNKHVKTHSDGSMNMAGSNNAMCEDDKCKESRECIVTPFNLGCCDKKTPHHIVPKSQFKLRGASVYTLPSGLSPAYDPNKAPCICETGTSHSNPGVHGDIHTETNILTVGHSAVKAMVTGKTIDANARWKVSQAEAVGAQAVEKATGCPKECTEAQVRKGHDNMGIKANDEIRPSTAGRVPDPSPPPSIGIPP